MAALVQEAKNNVLRIQSSLQPEDVSHLLREMDAFRIDPTQLDSFLPPLGTAASLANGGTGTYFFVAPVDESLDIDLVESEETTSPFKKTLIGFGNTMLAGASTLSLRTAFRDHQGQYIESSLTRTSSSTPTNFADADHTIIGEFDHTGTFHGKIRIYEEQIEYTLPPPAKYGNKTACGEFSLAFAYLQGDIKDLLLVEKDPEEYYRLNKRLKSVGGITSTVMGFASCLMGEATTIFWTLSSDGVRGPPITSFPTAACSARSRLHEKRTAAYKRRPG